MIACCHMAAMTAEPRWRALFATQAVRLLEDLEESDDGPLWTQDLYGRHLRYLGPLHGYAGNMIALMHGWEWLTDDQRARIARAVPRTLTANALRSEFGATWSGVVPDRDKSPADGDNSANARARLCQHCHGAPGMVTAFADAPFTSPELEELLREGGKFAWAAGPLAKGSNLCHGTGGNGYAFLKLYRRTNELIWLERARAFAMTAIAQYREARDQARAGPILVVDRRYRACCLFVGLREHRATVSDNRRLLNCFQTERESIDPRTMASLGRCMSLVAQAV